MDDGISGAEFEKRPGLCRLRSLIGQRAPFQILIVSENKSLGREMSETAYLIKQLDQAGVEVWDYSFDRCLTPRSSIDKIVSNVQGFADENHREKSSQRVMEAHSRLARRGHVTGGRVFGYLNRDVFAGCDEHGRPLRSHVERVVQETEAAVVRRIFDLYDGGFGLKRIAKELTNEGADTAKPVPRRDGLSPVHGWSPSTVRTILTREIYHGVIVWNKSRKRNSWGKVDQKARPESEWIRTPAEHLRVVPEDLWRRVDSRRREVAGRAVRFAGGRISGRPPKHATKNLLAGLATCSECGGGLVVETSPRKRGRVPEYVCHRHRHNGTCPNALRVPIAEVNEAVLQAVEAHALTPEAIEQVVQMTERDDVEERQSRLAREEQEIDRRMSRLVEAIETGGEAAPLMAKLRTLEARQQSIKAESASLRPVPRLEPAVVENRLGEWRRLLRQSTTQGRTVLQRILRGRITFTPRADGQGYDFTAPTRFDRLFTGVAVKRPAWVPDGPRPVLRPEDTFDSDYGLLLERVCGKGMASPRGTDPILYHLEMPAA
jgi:site-specific DNA recombinase